MLSILSGGLADTLWLQPGDPIVVSLHGTADDLVPYAFDSAQAAQSVEARLFGSFDVHTRATNIGLTSELKSFIGAGHAPHILPFPLIPPASYYMDTTIWVIRDFLYANIERKDLNTSVIEGETNQLQVHIYPNPASDIMFVNFEYNSDNYEVAIIDLLGREKLTLEPWAVSQVVIQKEELGNGLFVMQIRNKFDGKIILVKRILFTR